MTEISTILTRLRLCGIFPFNSMKILKEMNVVIMVSPNKKPSVRVVTDRRLLICHEQVVIAVR